jgi:hypothetical protein
MYQTQRQSKIEKLATEEYGNFLIEVFKRQHKSSSFSHYIMKIYDKTTKRQVHADSTFKDTKEEAMKEAKEYIDTQLQGKDFSKPMVKVGDIFVNSWGYDQTNYDYIIVTALSPTGKTVKARRTGHIDRGYSGQSFVQEPTNKPFGETFQLKVDMWGGEVHLVGSYPFLGTGTGSKHSGSFSKVEPGQKFQETDPQLYYTWYWS